MENNITKKQMQSAMDILFGEGNCEVETLKDALEKAYRCFSWVLLDKVIQQADIAPEITPGQADSAQAICWLSDLLNEQLNKANKN